MPTFKTIHTLYGLRALAAAEASNVPVNLTHVAVGDGNGNAVEPQDTQTHLVRERFRAVINRIYQDTDTPTKFIAEMVIPSSVGGFTLREFCVLDDKDGMFVVGNLPDTYKPTGADGAFSDTVLRVEFYVQNASVVTVQADPNVAVATQSWVINNITSSVLIPGGTTGQLLRKLSNADGDTEWHDPDAINVTVDTIEETQELALGQTVVDLAVTTTRGLALYIDGERLRRDQWTADPIDLTQLTLGTSYPAGTKLIAAQNEPTGNAPAPLERSKNLSDVENAGTARTNIDVYSKAEADRICPVGTPSHFPSTTLPVGWVVRNGAALSRTAYAKLFAVIGTTYGAGDGFNTFNVPDDRGGFDGNADLGRGMDAAMTMGGWLSSQNKWHGHGISISDVGNHTHPISIDAAGEHIHALNTNGVAAGTVGPMQGALHAGNGKISSSTTAAGNHVHSASSSGAGAHTHSATIAADGSDHARPNGRAYMPIMRAY